MWRHVPRIALLGARATTCVRRRQTFLTAAYQCADTWNNRLAATTLTAIRPEQFYYDLDQQFQQSGKCSAIDIDLFANHLKATGYHDEIADLLHRQRNTDETTSILSSTGHALIRYYIDHDNVNELFPILNDPISYGVFLDSYTANLMLDKLIRSKDYAGAARISTFMMLQEDFTNAITTSMSLYAIWKFLQLPNLSFDTPSVAAAAEETAEAAAATETAPKKPAAKKKKEEIRVRVDYLRNQFFDDHFDLTDCRQLVGKTLLMIAAETSDAAAQKSVELLGLFYRGKYAEATEVLRTDGQLYKDVIDHVVSQLASVVGAEAEAEKFVQFSEVLTKLATDGGGIGESFEKSICNAVEKAVAKNESADIDEQKKVRFNLTYYC